MNKKHLFFAAAAALSLACSCEKNNVSESTVMDFFEVTLPGSISTKAVEDPHSAGAIVPYYSDVTVYLVDRGDNATAYTWTDEEIKARTKRFEQVVEPASVIVVANAGSISLPTGTTNRTVLSQSLKSFKAEDQNKPAVTLSAADSKGNAAGTYSSVQQVALWGEAASSSFVSKVSDDSHTQKEVSVNLKSVVSRFEVGTLVPKVDGGLVSLKVDAVYINYMYRAAAMDTNWGYTASTWPSPYDPTWATDAGSTEVTSEAGTKCYAYQVFTGALVPHIIFMVSGETASGYMLSDGTEGTFTGKFVTVKGFKVDGKTLIGNNGDATDDTSSTQYEMKAHEIYKMLAAIPITPDQITPDPEPEKIDLFVNITVAPWTTQTITPEI